MLRVRGDSMIEAGILDGDYVVVRQQSGRPSGRRCGGGDTGWGSHSKNVLPSRRRSRPATSEPNMGPMGFPASDVTIYGKVVTVLRRL